MILTRNKKRYYFNAVYLPPKHKDFSKFTFNVGTVTPYSLVAMLQDFYNKRGFQLRRNIKGYLREAKKFLETYGEDKALALMGKAAELANHPWGFTFLHKLGKQYYGI